MENSKYSPEELALFNEEGIDVNAIDNDITDDNSQGESRSDINEDLPGAEEDNPQNIPADNTDVSEPQKETTPLIGGKFKTYDDLLKAYNELEKYSGSQASQISELRKQVAGGNGQGQETVPERTTQGDMFGNVTNEQLSEFMIGHPKEFVEQIVNQLRNDVASMTERENTVNKYVDDFFSENSDIADYKDEFRELCNELNNPRYALEVIRGRKAGNLDELMANEDYVKRNLEGGKLNGFLNDESIYEKLGDNVKQKIIDDYVKSVKQSKSNASPISGETGYASKVPPKKYSDFTEMSDDAIEYLKELEKSER